MRPLLPLAVSLLAGFTSAMGLLGDVYRDNLLVASGWAGNDLVVPPSALAGVRIWRRRPWGYALAAITSVKGALYMIALSAATLGAWSAGALASLSQLAVWGAIGTAYAVVTRLLLKRTQPRGA